jgi:hypothetical protein
MRKWSGGTLVGAAMLIAAGLPGCGRESPVATGDDPGSSATVAIDVSALHRPPVLGMQGPCASLAATMALRVTPQRGTVQNFSRAIPAEASIIRFESIDVTEGQVVFSVVVTSDNGTTLYSGEVTEQISPPTFQVNLSLSIQAPVLQVCPGHIVLDRSTNFSESVQVLNRGIGALTYEAVAPMCERGPCIGFEVPAGTAVPGPGNQLFAFLPQMTTQTSLELRVQSPGGSVPIAVTLGQLPDLVVDTLVATDTVLFTKEGPQQPVQVVIRNVGNAPAEIFKVAAEYTGSNGTFVGRFLVPGQADPFYPFTQDPLAPGGQVTLDGLIQFSTFGSAGPVLFRVEADSCSSEEDHAPYCRIDEFDESNNISPELLTVLP